MFTLINIPLNITEREYEKIDTLERGALYQ